MARRRTVRLLLAVVLAAVLFHPDAAVEAEEEVPAKTEGVLLCGACEVKAMKLNVTEAVSPVNKMPPIGEMTNVCKQVTDAGDVRHQLVFKGEELHCNAKCRTAIERVLLEVMKHDNDILWFLAEKKRSIQQLLDKLCDESPKSTQGDDDHNESGFVTTIKSIGRGVKKVKNLGHMLLNFGRTPEPTNQTKACRNLQASLK